jgi:septum formation protein
MSWQLPFPLILASGSLGRRELLAQAGFGFDVLPANIDEPTGAGVTDIRAFVQDVAWHKAAAVAPRVAEGVVLAADTVAWLNGEVIGKPADEADARRILTLLGGTEHELWTGVVLWRRPDDLQVAWQECSRVAFRHLSPAELDTYLATRTWQGCSGAYAIKEKDDPYVRVVRGSASNVVGLPMETTRKILGWLAGQECPTFPGGG